jgi:hypothetical protein
VAESFDSDAEGYERARPNYPDELIAQIAAVSRGPQDARRRLRDWHRHQAASGRWVLGIDPEDRMAELVCRAGLDIACQALVTF